MKNSRRRALSFSMPKKIPRFLWHVVRCIFIVKSPVSFIYNYIAVRSPKERMVLLRNGAKIYLSDNPEDIVTVFRIFVMREYGKIIKDRLTLDIGANIGVFSLYACMSGARKIYAYEPNHEAYNLLCKNITCNGLSDIIVPYRFAVSITEGDEVKFPTTASPQNKIITDENISEYESVKTINLEGIIESNKIDKVDLLKLDCQGMEYDIVNHLNDRVISKIKSIKLEYHQGNEGILISKLIDSGFTLEHQNIESASMGNLWFFKKEYRNNLS